MKGKNDRRLLKVEEVAQQLSCSKRHVWALAARGALETVKLGPKCTRFHASDVDRLVAEGVR